MLDTSFHESPEGFKFTVEVPARVVHVSRSRDPGARLRVRFETPVMFPEPPPERKGLIKRFSSRIEGFLDENMVRDLAEAARRWPMDPAVGLWYAIAKVYVEIDVLKARFENDSDRIYSDRILGFRSPSEWDLSLFDPKDVP